MGVRLVTTPVFPLEARRRDTGVEEFIGSLRTLVPAEPQWLPLQGYTAAAKKESEDAGIGASH